jgi:hypothetical protein
MLHAGRCDVLADDLSIVEENLEFGSGKNTIMKYEKTIQTHLCDPVLLGLGSGALRAGIVVNR